MSLADLRFRQVWAVDFEFKADPGECPVPVCLVAHELISGVTHRCWGDDLHAASPPYSVDDDSLFIAYYASAEFGCHLALGWALPSNVIDLYAEFRAQTNGKPTPCGQGLLGALTFFGEEAIEAQEKDAMRTLILRGAPYSPDEQAAILDYCESDVHALAKLVPHLLPAWLKPVGLGHALLRGRYAKAVARIEHAGIPLDGDLLGRLRTNWDSLKDQLIATVDRDYEVYEGRTFKQQRFTDYLKKHDIPWPRLPSGRLALDEDTFSEQTKSFPKLRPLKELRQALGQLRLHDLAVGQDGRNRCLLSMFSAKTGRNQPSTTKFVFGLSAWLRGLIKPRPGCGLAYIDWSQQEFGIAAALSRDARMLEAYSSGDPYLTFAKQAGAAPADATKASHAEIREQFKACTLAVQYGMGEEALGRRIGQPTIYARQLLKLHHQTYRTFWAWSDGVVDYAQIHRKLWTLFGWQLYLSGKINDRSVRNFPMQANGAELLRLACCLGTEAGIRIVAPVHDAVLIEAPLEELESASLTMQDIMAEASEVVLDGFRLRSDVKLIRAPERYGDARGESMWATVMNLLEAPCTSKL